MNGKTSVHLAKQAVFFFAGLWILSWGIVCTVKADLGVAPWDTLHIGLSMVLGLTIGFWMTVVGILIVGLTCLLTREWPRWGTLGNMLFVGPFVDAIMWMELVPDPESLVGRWGLFFIGLLLIAAGVGMYIAPKVGAGPRDGLTLELSRLSGWSIGRVRTIMEMTVLCAGWLLGGPIHIGTLFFCVFTGPLMQASIRLFDRVWGNWLKRGDRLENIDKGTVRPDDHDGSGFPLREGTDSSEERGRTA
ncbi:YczE/YyaS/YitT family protein [Staphylospora marina]|uniref:YczE/YyaS/YitT family protein n=1 Tax=Staphylospora marina TaxID=2490858 RepID=UPI000F5BABCF|nr:YitT family protein [Staphylospora marina]